MPKVTSSSNHSANILSIFLSKISAQNLHTRLKDVAQSNKTAPADIDALLAALQRLGISVISAQAAAVDRTPLHCVRCHKEYLERDNTIESCEVDHIYNDDPIRWNGGHNYTCEECGETFWEENAGNGWDETKCFVGSHTTHRYEVEEGTENCKKNGCPGHENDEDTEEDTEKQSDDSADEDA
jgi:hypothetical protein